MSKIISSCIFHFVQIKINAQVGDKFSDLAMTIRFRVFLSKNVFLRGRRKSSLPLEVELQLLLHQCPGGLFGDQVVAEVVAKGHQTQVAAVT